jgi:MFS family permease
VALEKEPTSTTVEPSLPPASEAAIAEPAVGEATGDTMPHKIWHAGTLGYTTSGLIRLFCWLLWGDFAWSMRDRTVGPVLQMMLKKFSASDTLTGILLGSLPLIISMILSPVISYKSDNHRGRWGRRIPFLLIPTPFIALAMVGLAFSPLFGESLHRILGSHSPGLNHATLLFFALFWTIFGVSTVVANAVFGGLINDVVPEPVLGRFFGAFRALSLIAGIAFNYWLFGKAEVEYFWVFLGMGTLYGVGFSLMCLKVKEGQYPSVPSAGRNRGVGAFLVAAKSYFKECFGISYYWWYYAASSLSWMAFMPFGLFNYYYATSLKMDSDTFGKCTALTFVFSLLLAYPLGVLADRLHPLRLALIVQSIYVLMTLLAGMLVNDATSFGIALVIHGVLSGTWMTAAASLGQRLLPKENFAQFSSAGGIIGSLCGIVAGPAAGLFLDRVVDHDYRYTFFMNSGMAALAFVAGLVLYRKFIALGGPKNYVAPA